MKRKNERGVALILTLILLLIVSVMAVSLMFISQPKPQQHRYHDSCPRRETAVKQAHQRGGKLHNQYLYAASQHRNRSAFRITTTTYRRSNILRHGGNDVILATSNSGQSYEAAPVSSVVTAFGSNAQNSLAAGNVWVEVQLRSAKLLSQVQVIPYGTTTFQTVQTWQITSDSAISGIRNADEEVSAIWKSR